MSKKFAMICLFATFAVSSYSFSTATAGNSLDRNSTESLKARINALRVLDYLRPIDFVDDFEVFSVAGRCENVRHPVFYNTTISKLSNCGIYQNNDGYRSFTPVAGLAEILSARRQPLAVGLPGQPSGLFSQATRTAALAVIDCGDWYTVTVKTYHQDVFDSDIVVIRPVKVKRTITLR